MKKIFRVSSLALVTGLAFASLYPAATQAWSFDPAMLNSDALNTDIAIFEQGGQLPGIYSVEILLNGKRIDSRDMIFHQTQNAAGKPVLKTCLTRAQLVRYGVKVEAYPDLFAAGKAASVQDAGDGPAEQCANLSAIPYAAETFVFNQQQLVLSIPQVALRPPLSGITPQELWNDGIPAILMNYRANASRSEWRGHDKTVNNAFYAQLEPGANLGPWRLRNLTLWQKNGHQPGKWQTAWTYAERGLYDLKSRLTLGDRYTSSDIFDSVLFRGAMLASDELMVPYNQREFAPVVRGIAHSQARIEVRQNGYVIYNNTVAPGPFALTDLPVFGSSGDLQVTVTEADGQTQIFTVPSTTPAIALREGYLKYGLMAGQYRPSDTTINAATVGQATIMYGLPWGLTAYGGLQVAEHYQAVALGLGASLGYAGAISVDGIQSQGRKQGRRTERGHIWRLRYSKMFATTNTSFTLASYQYASSGFSTLSEVLNSYRGKDSGELYYDYDPGQRKSRTTLTLSQSLGPAGYLSLTAARENFWHQTRPRNELTASWGSSWRNVSWSLNLTQRQSLVSRYSGSGYDRKNEQEVSLWVSLPLDSWLGGNTRATYQMLNGNNRDTQYEAGLNGDALNRQLHWDVRQRMTPGSRYGDRNSSLINLRWYGPYGELTGGYSYSKTSRQMNAGVAGGVIAHQHGVTAGQPLGQTVALVAAPGVAGVSAGGGTGVKTDWRGYTTLSYMSPYQENTVTLDPSTLPPDAELPQTDIKVVPTAGAVIPATFAARIGGRAVITLMQTDGRPVPFGALVTLSGEKSHTTGGAGVTGKGGELYMSGLPQQATLQATWGDGQHCQAAYQLPQKKGPAGVYILSATCAEGNNVTSQPIAAPAATEGAQS